MVHPLWPDSKQLQHTKHEKKNTTKEQQKKTPNKQKGLSHPHIVFKFKTGQRNSWDSFGCLYVFRLWCFFSVCFSYGNDRYTFPSLNSMLTCFDRCYWEHCCQFRGGIILFSWRWQSNEGVWCSQLWYDQHAETWVSCSVLENAYLGLWWEVILCRRQVNSLTFFFFWSDEDEYIALSKMLGWL